MKVLLFFWKQIMWYSEVGAEENIRLAPHVVGVGGRKQKNQIENRSTWRERK